MSEPTYTITVTGATAWKMLGAYLLASFLSPFLTGIATGICSVIRKRNAEIDTREPFE